jgi:hypothetical protein
MPTYPTPGKVSATVNLPVGDLLIMASERSNTVVLPDVDENDKSGLRVSYADGRLTVDGPQPRTNIASWFGFGDSPEVRIDLPDGSAVRGTVLEGGIRGVGTLGECTFRADEGEIELERTGRLTVNTENGDTTVREVVGHAHVTSENGGISIRRIDGSAEISNQYGETEIGEVTGGLRVHGRDGTIAIGRAHGDVDARSDSGDIDIAEVTQGVISIVSDSGSIEIGVPEGVAAVFDLKSRSGYVRNPFESGPAAGPSDRVLTIQAHTQDGDISINPVKASQDR